MATRPAGAAGWPGHGRSSRASSERTPVTGPSPAASRSRSVRAARSVPAATVTVVTSAPYAAGTADTPAVYVSSARCSGTTASQCPARASGAGARSASGRWVQVTR